MNGNSSNYLSTTVVALAVSITSLAVYHFATASARQRIATVDLATVYAEKEAQFSKVLTKDGVTMAKKTAALTDAQVFAKTLSKSLDELATDCNCTVLLANAVAGHSATEDLTPELRNKVGL